MLGSLRSGALSSSGLEARLPCALDSFCLARPQLFGSQTGCLSLPVAIIQRRSPVFTIPYSAPLPTSYFAGGKARDVLLDTMLSIVCALYHLWI